MSFCCAYCTISSPGAQEAVRSVHHYKTAGLKLCFKPGQILFYEGHEPNGVFMLLSGKVLLKKAPRRKHKIIEAPQILSLEHLMLDTLNCCSAEAMGSVEVLFFSRAFMMSYVFANNGDKSIPFVV